MILRSPVFIAVLIAFCISTSPVWSAPDSACLAMAEKLPQVQHAAYLPTALTEGQVELRYAGHSTFIITSHSGVKIATDYSGFSEDVLPDVVTMIHAHHSHYTDTPDPRIKHVLRGWNPAGGPAHHDIQVGDVRIRNVTTDIRTTSGRIPDGNSIFIFEVAGLCIGHLGHLHHELTSAHLAQIGRLDVVLVPVDGGYTMAQLNMMQVLKDLRARLIIPMHYFGEATLQRFLATARKDFDVDYMAGRSLVISQEDLPRRSTVMVPAN